MSKNPLILAVETSGRAGSAAIALGQNLLAESTFSGPMRHSAELFPAVCNLLERFDKKPKDIEHIYISIGPGSFTGLRIAATLAKTMNLANNAKIVAVDTLDVIAANVGTLAIENIPQLSSRETIATILDAKRGQFFIAIYQRSSDEHRTSSTEPWNKILPDCLMTAPQFLDQFACRGKPIRLLGEGLVYYKDKFKADGVYFLDEKFWTPRAEKVHLLGWRKAQANRFEDPLTLQPTYLRRPDVKVKQY